MLAPSIIRPASAAGIPIRSAPEKANGLFRGISRPRRLVLVGGLLALTALGEHVSASDAELQSALQRSGCNSPTIKQILQRGDITVYEANCSQTSHRVITVTCTKRTCHVAEPGRENEQPRR